MLKPTGQGMFVSCWQNVAERERETWPERSGLRSCRGGLFGGNNMAVYVRAGLEATRAQ